MVRVNWANREQRIAYCSERIGHHWSNLTDGTRWCSCCGLKEQIFTPADATKIRQALSGDTEPAE